MSSKPNRPDETTELKFAVTNTLIVQDIKRSVAFYRDVLGATVQHEGEPTYLRLANVIASPPRDPNLLSIFINLRVNDIQGCYGLWSSRGAKFITEPKVHATGLRCYMRDPDGYRNS